MGVNAKPLGGSGIEGTFSGRKSTIHLDSFLASTVEAELSPDLGGDHNGSWLRGSLQPDVPVMGPDRENVARGRGLWVANSRLNCFDGQKAEVKSRDSYKGLNDIPSLFLRCSTPLNTG
jgi:hypothetical protein